MGSVVLGYGMSWPVSNRIGRMHTPTSKVIGSWCTSTLVIVFPFYNSHILLLLEAFEIPLISEPPVMSAIVQLI